MYKYIIIAVTIMFFVSCETDKNKADKGTPVIIEQSDKPSSPVAKDNTKVPPSIPNI